MTEITHFKDGTPVPMVYTWQGKDIEKLGRDELLKALKGAIDEIYELRNDTDAFLERISASPQS